MARPLLLLTNDDGIAAPGLRALAEAVEDLGDVIVAAPDVERSGCGHAMTFNQTLRAQPAGPDRWAVGGTPADCVYFALHHVCARRPALVLSGVNAGLNLGTDVFYSGTFAGAAEGHLRGLSGIAVSVDRGVDPHQARSIVRELVGAWRPDDPPVLLNVNVPAAPPASGGEHRPAVAITRLGRRTYHDAVDERRDPYGRPYYWIGGPPGQLRGRAGDDTWAVASGIVSVTPIRLQLDDPEPTTARALVERAVADRLVCPRDPPPS